MATAATARCSSESTPASPSAQRKVTKENVCKCIIDNGYSDHKKIKEKANETKRKRKRKRIKDVWQKLCAEWAEISKPMPLPSPEASTETTATSCFENAPPASP
jgi:hypothetical protein